MLFPDSIAEKIALDSDTTSKNPVKMTQIKKVRY